MNPSVWKHTHTYGCTVVGLPNRHVSISLLYWETADVFLARKKAGLAGGLSSKDDDGVRCSLT